jgi:hypothetical protein
MPDSSQAHYASRSEEFMRLPAGEFRQSVASEQEHWAAACRYFRRGVAAGYSHG